jgi:hypothetical protein
MALKLGDTVPNFKAQISPSGETIDFHEAIGTAYGPVKHARNVRLHR